MAAIKDAPSNQDANITIIQVVLLLLVSPVVVYEGPAA